MQGLGKVVHRLCAHQILGLRLSSITIPLCPFLLFLLSCILIVYTSHPDSFLTFCLFTFLSEMLLYTDINPLFMDCVHVGLQTFPI